MEHFLKYFLWFVEFVTCFLLVGVILLQKPRSHGAGMAFGAGVGESLFGAQTGNVLTKTTVILAIVFLANTTLLYMLGFRIQRSGRASVVDKVPARTAPARPGPSGGAEQPPLVPGPAGAETQPLVPAAPAGSAGPVTPVPSIPPAPAAPIEMPAIPAPAGGATPPPAPNK